MNLSTRLMGFHLAVAKNSPLLGRPCKGTRSRGREPRAGLPAFRADRRRLRELAEAEDLNPADETSRAQDRVVNPKCLDQVRGEATQFPDKLLSRQNPMRTTPTVVEALHV